VATAGRVVAHGPRARVAGVDMSAAIEVFKIAGLVLVPEDQSQRQAFATLMPEMYGLRNRGCSFKQLADLLSQCGFRLEPSTVRQYYSELIESRMDVCQERMNEQILIMAEVKKVTEGVDMHAITGRVSAILEKQRSAATSKADSMFGLAPGGDVVRPAEPAGAAVAAVRREPATPARTNAGAGLRPAPEKQQQLQEPTHNGDDGDEDDGDSFGLLGSPNAAAPNAGKPTFFDLGDAPSIPDLTRRPTAAVKNAAASPHGENQEQSHSLRCKDIEPGTKRLGKRPNVPAIVYEAGNLEHPAVPGLLLSLEQRLCSVALEFVDEDAVIRLETLDEKRFRVIWKAPVPVTKTTTSNNFTEMDTTLFRKT
jgi:hypothetical protein